MIFKFCEISGCGLTKEHSTHWEDVEFSGLTDACFKLNELVKSISSNVYHNVSPSHETSHSFNRTLINKSFNRIKYFTHRRHSITSKKIYSVFLTNLIQYRDCYDKHTSLPISLSLLFFARRVLVGGRSWRLFATCLWWNFFCRLFSSVIQTCVISTHVPRH